MKSEVRALEYAVCALVAKLEVLLVAEWGLRIFIEETGLEVSTPEHLPTQGTDVSVTIRPKGWSKASRIHARFFRYGATKWKLTDFGEVWSDDPQIPVNGLRFIPTDDGLGIRLQPGLGEYSKYFVVNGYNQLIASLEKDKKKLQP